MDFNKICRVCLLEKSNFNSIFDASIAKMIMACASVVILEGDNLPNQICKQCIINVSRAYRFKELCEKSDKTLREYINSTRYNDIIDTTQAQLKSIDLLLNDNSNLVNSCSFTDIFMKNDNSLNEPLIMDQSALSSTLDVNLQMQNIDNQCLPFEWDDRRIDFPGNSNDNFNHNIIVNVLQTFDCDKQSKNDWNIDLNNDIDSSTYTKSYIDLDHSSRIINEDRSKKQNKIFNCEICDQTFNDMKNFKEHNHLDLNTTNEKKYICSFCGKRYKENKLLMLHLRSHTGNRPLKCDYCGKSFSLPSSLHKHIKLHTSEKNYKCPICGGVFYQSSNLNSHMRVHTGEKPFVCTLCGKTFAFKRNLVTHTRIHNGDKPFECVTCKASFSTSSLLKRHATKHSNEKKHICVHCGDSFRLKNVRDAHIRFQHTGSRPYSCTLCPKQYVKASQLYNHMLAHSNERRHQCSVCNKVFLQKRYLRSHMNTHLGQRPYVCSICNNGFSNSGTLSTHMKTHKKMTELQE